MKDLLDDPPLWAWVFSQALVWYIVVRFTESFDNEVAFVSLVLGLELVSMVALLGSKRFGGLQLGKFLKVTRHENRS